jgi:hypothetical protein
MLTLTGVLVNVFNTPIKQNKEGESYGGQDKVQLLADMVLDNGEKKKELVTLTAHDSSFFIGLEGTELEIPVGVMSMGKNNTIFYILKSWKPTAQAA